MTVHEQSDEKAKLIYVPNSFAAGESIFLSEPSWHKLLIASLAIVLLCWDLGKARLADWDEAIYAQISKEILQSHNWLNLSWGHVPWFEKPPLFMWGTAVFFKVFGVSEIGARALSAICGIMLILLTYSIGRRLYGVQVGLYSSLILLTSIQFISFSRFGTTDVALSFCIYLSLYGYIRARTGDASWWYLVWISIGLGAMVKGPGVLIAIMVIAIDLALDRGLRKRCRSREFWLGIVCAVLIVAPWHLLMVAHHGGAFLNAYFWYQIAARIASPLEGHEANSLYYIKGLVRGFLPWLLITPFAFVFAIREIVFGSSRSRILLLASGIVLALYSAVRTKLIWYIIPCYPALAILNAAYIVHLANRRRNLPKIFFGIVVAAFCFTFYVAAVKSAYIAAVSSAPEESLTHLLVQGKQQERASDKSPLLLSARRYLPTPAALFYSNRQSVEIVSLPDDLPVVAERVRINGHADAIVERSLLTELSVHFAIDEVDRKGDMVYVEIQLKR